MIDMKMQNRAEYGSCPVGGIQLLQEEHDVHRGHQGRLPSKDQL